jgi:hypothetical protein
MESQVRPPSRRRSVPLSFKISGVVAAGLLIVNSVLGILPTPNVVGLAEEYSFELFLSSHPTHDDVVGWLRNTHADWHLGQDLEGNYYAPPSPSDKCSKKCGTAVQVAYETWCMICFGAADRITVLFDTRDRASSWKVTPTGDGC